MADVHFGGASPSSIFDSESGYMITTIQAYYGDVAIEGATPTVYIGMKGNTNLNKSVEVEDAVRILSYYAMASAAMNPTFSDDETMHRFIYIISDVDGDLKISVEDAVKVLEFYARQSAGLNPTW